MPFKIKILIISRLHHRYRKHIHIKYVIVFDILRQQITEIQRSTKGGKFVFEINCVAFNTSYKLVY